MALVAPVNLPYNIKTLWFDPNDLVLNVDDKVVVKTSRGQELGVMASDPIEVTEEDIENLKSPLMPVLRVATEDDLLRAKEMEEKSAIAMEVFKRLARETSEEMHPVSVEYMLDGEKAVFYFESEERIDFRELVRKLASEFHVRIDMRQIGVRDEARIVGGIAHCGQVVCCKRLGGEFKPVSIRMAKEQDLSLNPQKISGLCGRLMCCLRYESDIYADFKKTAPKIGSLISTPAGMGKVSEIDIPKEAVTIKIEDEKPVKVPVSMIEDLSEDRKSARVNDSNWEKLMEEVQSAIFERGGMFDLPKFTTEDKLGSAKAVHHEKAASSSSNGSSRDHSGEDASKPSKRKPRGSKRRSVKIALGGGDTESDSKPEQKSESSKPQHSHQGKGERNRRSGNNSNNRSSRSKGQTDNHSSKLRPGHKSSALSQGANDAKSGSDDKKGGNRKHRRRHSSKNKSDASS